MGSLWFLLMMWAGAESFLKNLQKMVDNFVWAGRSRVNKAILTLPTTEGGLALPSIINQYSALSGTLLIILGSFGRITPLEKYSSRAHHAGFHEKMGYGGS